MKKRKYTHKPAASAARLTQLGSILACATAALSLTPSEAQAQFIGTWSSTSGANWDTQPDWTTSGPGVPGLTTGGDIADFSKEILTQNITVKLDGNYTLGQLLIGDAGGKYSYTIAEQSGTNFALNFNNGGSDAIISAASTSAGDTISGMPIGLTGNLDIYNYSANNLTISGSISGAGSAINIDGGGGTGAVVLGGSNSYTGGLNINAGQVILTNAYAGGSGPITVGTSGAVNAGLFASGVTINAANITINPNNTGTILIGASGTYGAPTFSGTLSAPGTVNLVAADNGATFQGLSISNNGGVNISNTSCAVSTTGQSWGLAPGGVTFTGSNSYTGDTRIQSGILYLSGGSGATVDNFLGSSLDPIYLGGTSGALSAELAISFGNQNTLTRAITVQAGSGGLSYIAAPYSGSGKVTYTGPITLNQSVELFPTTTRSASYFDGAISTGTGALGEGVSVICNASLESAQAYLGGVNSYNGGTIVASGMLSSNNASALGTGNVLVEGGVLLSPANTDLPAAGKTVTIGPLGAMSFSGWSQAQLSQFINGSSSGAFGIYNSNFSSALNLSQIGDGTMYFYGDNNGNATYVASSLGADSDGNYRLGWAANNNGTLELTRGVLVGSGTVIIGGAQGNVTPFGGDALTTNGYVRLDSANSYSGGTVINSASKLTGVAQTTTGASPFGSASAPMTLHGGQVVLTNTAANVTTTTVGGLNFDGASSVTVGGTTGGSNTFAVGAITRNNNATLWISPTGTGSILGTNAILTTTSSVPLATINSGTATLAPIYYFDSTNNRYVTYGASGYTGFSDALVGATSITGTDNYVELGNSATVATSSTVSALGLGAGAGLSISSGQTLTITSGGLNNGGATAQINTSGAGSISFGNSEGVIIATGQTLQIANPLIGTNGLTKAGGAQLNLTASNPNLSGTVTVDAGILNVASDSSLGNASNPVVLNGGALQGPGQFTMAHNVVVGLNGGTLLGASGGGSLPVITVNGIVSGTGAYLDLYTSSYLTLSNGDYQNSEVILSNTANNFSAPIYVFGRNSLLFSNPLQLGNSSNTVSLYGGNAGLVYTGSADASMSNGILFPDQGGELEVVSSTNTLTENGPVSGSGMFVKNGPGTLALTASNSFTGNFTVNAGTVLASNANALGASTAVVTGSNGVSGSPVFVQGGATLGLTGNISIGDKTMYLNGSGVGGAGALSNVSGSNSFGGQIVLQSDSVIGTGSNSANSLTLTRTISGAAGLTVTGKGVLNLAGANTYTGPTYINGNPTVLVSGALNGTSATMVAANATLGGGGQIAAPVTVNGTLAPGATLNSAGTTLTIGNNVTFNDGSQFTVNLDDPNDKVDLLAVSGSLTLSGNSSLLIDLVNGSMLSGSSYEIASFTPGDLTGTFGNILVEGGSLNGYNVVYDNADGVIDLQAVPEPSTWASFVGGLGVLSLFGARRRRSQLARKAAL